MARVDLTWGAPATGNASYYEVYRRTVPNPWADPLVPLNASNILTESYSDTTAVANNTYVYEVRAFSSGGGGSPLSDKVFVGTTTTSDVTSAPRSLALSSGFPTTTGIKFEWLVPTTVPGTISAYVIFRDGVEVFTQPADDLNYKDDVGPSETHSYYVKARSGNGVDSPASNTITPTSLADTEAPTPPSNLVLTASTSGGVSSVTVDWNASLDNYKVRNYIIRRSGSGIPTIAVQTVAHPTTIWVDDNKNPDTTYNYSVEADDDAGNVSGNTSLSVHTPAANTATNVYKVPDTPTNFTNLQTGGVESYYVDCTGLTDCTLAFRRWVREAVPDGTDFFNRTIIKFPATGGFDAGAPYLGAGTALLLMESGIRFNTRHFISVKANGARVMCKTGGHWVSYKPEVDEPGWPKKRIHVGIVNCNSLDISDLGVLGHHWRGNPHHVPNVDPADPAYSMRIHVQDAGGISATATTIDVEKSLRGRPLKKDEWWSTTYAANGPGGSPALTWTGSMAKNAIKPFDGYYLYIGNAAGDNAYYESILVTADVAHPTVAGWRRLTVERGKNQPQGAGSYVAGVAQGVAWPQGSNMGPGKIGAHGAGPGSTAASYEFQHGFSIVRGGIPGVVGRFDSLKNCVSRHPNGSNFEVSDWAISTSIIDCWADFGGRQGFTPNSADDLFVENLTINDVAWSAIDLEPAANTTKMRDCIIKGTDSTHPMKVSRIGGAFFGNLGRGRGNNGDPVKGMAPDGRYYVDNIVVKDIEVLGTAGVRGDITATAPDGARGKHTFLRITALRQWGSPVELIKLYRCKGVTIKGYKQDINVLQNRNPISLNARSTGYDVNGVEQEVILGTNHVINPACRTDAGGSIGRRTNNVPDTDNNFTGAITDWRGTYQGYVGT